MKLRSHQQESIQEMFNNDKGIIVAPTGAGKSLIQVMYTRELFNNTGSTVVIVAPRILLSIQLCSEFEEHIVDAQILHVHSGNTHHENTTNEWEIADWCEQYSEENKLIFTTYNSLHKIVESEIKIDCILFDEAHNSVKRSFYDFGVKPVVEQSERAFFFTATPKYSNVANKPGMNWSETFGNIIYNVSAPDLIRNGSILPPKVQVMRVQAERDKGEGAAERDCMTLLDSILNEDHMQKVLVCAPNTKVLIRMLAETDFMNEIQSYGYDVFWITAKHGSFLNNKKISRDQFFSLIEQYGKDDSKKFIVLHYSILSEGISVPGLTSCIIMRQMNIIEMTQSIGRVLRLHLDDIRAIQTGQIAAGDVESYRKSFGLIHLPVYDNVGIATVRRLESIFQTVFEEGQPAISTIQK